MKLEKANEIDTDLGVLQNAYLLTFYFDKEVDESIYGDCFGNVIDFDYYYVYDSSKDSIQMVVAFTDKYDIDEYLSFYIEKVKKEVPQILLDWYGIVATPQEYEIPEGE